MTNDPMYIPDIALDLRLLADRLARKGYGVGGVKVQLKPLKKQPGQFSAYYVIRPTPVPSWTTEHTYRHSPDRVYTQYHQTVSVYGGLTGTLKQIEGLPERVNDAA